MNNIKEIHTIQDNRVVHFDVKQYCSNVDYLLARIKELQNGVQVHERKIGEFITTLWPIDDSTVQLLDGSLLTYTDHKDFYEYMYNLQKSKKFPDLFTFEDDWQTENDDCNGCGKFVIDTKNLTVRVPNYTFSLLDGSSEGGSSAKLYMYIVVRVPDSTPYVIEQDQNHRLWSNGFCECYGRTQVQNNSKVDLPIQYLNNYSINITPSKNLEIETDLDSFTVTTSENLEISYSTQGYVDISNIEFNNVSNLAPIPNLIDFENSINHKLDENIDLVNNTVQSTNTRLDQIVSSIERINDIKKELDNKLDQMKNDVYNIKLIKFKSDKQNGYRVYSDGYCEQWGYVAACVNDLKVTLQIPYRDNYFNVSATSAYRDTQNRRWGSCGVDSSSSIWLMTSAGSAEASSTSIIWHTWGYVNLSNLDLSTVEG